MQRSWWFLGGCLLVFGLGLSRSQNGTSSGYRSYAKYLTEEDALKEGERRGLGFAHMEGPREVIADTLVNFHLRFTVGKAGMKTGGGIRLASAHGMRTNWGGESAQIASPNAENYISFRTLTGAGLVWKLWSGNTQGMFDRFHPWQNMNEFKLTGPDLRPGDRIEIDLSRMRVQRWAETAFLFKFYVDAFGDDDFLPLRQNPSFRIRAGNPVELLAIAPSDLVAGQAGWVNVWASDEWGNPCDAYRGAVVLEAEGKRYEHTFSAADGGAYLFEGLVFPKTGTFRVQVKEKNGHLSATSNPIQVQASDPRQKLYWGDLHTHTIESMGRGTPAEMYELGQRVAALDFLSVTDHSFLVDDPAWRRIRETTNRFYKPGRFVTFLGYEWSGMSPVGGDHNVYTVDSDMPLIRCYSNFNYQNYRMYHGPNKAANHVEDLFRMLGEKFRNENLMVIPHYGGRPGNPAFHNPALQRQIEIFSVHRRSEDWAMRFLKNGYRLGILASTDTHETKPGFATRPEPVEKGDEGPLFSKHSPAERGTALVAVYAGKLTREGVFQALYHRQTYATTGSRIILQFQLEGAPMGSEVRVKRPPRIVASAEGTAPIKVMRVVKNGEIVHAIESGSMAASLEYVDTSGDYQNKFYYIDLVQQDGEKAISSPIWVN